MAIHEDQESHSKEKCLLQKLKLLTVHALFTYLHCALQDNNDMDFVAVIMLITLCVH